MGAFMRILNKDKWIRRAEEDYFIYERKGRPLIFSDKKGYVVHKRKDNIFDPCKTLFGAKIIAEMYYEKNGPEYLSLIHI